MSFNQRSTSPRRLRIVVIALVVCWSAAAPGLVRGDVRSAELRTMTPGVWGGDHIRMAISREGAQVEYDCATGTIDQPIALDAGGKFTVKGSYTSEHGGPRRKGEAAGARARYVGRVSAETMTLTVTLEAGAQQVGRFTLTRGNDPLLTKCR